MATLTGERIKDTYDGLLKLEDSQAITSSSKVVTDGLGNASALSVSTIGIDVSGDAQVTGELEVNSNVKLLDKLEFTENSVNDYIESLSYALRISSDDAINFAIGGSSVINLYSAQVRPQANNTVDLGHSSFGWKTVRAAGNITTTSGSVGIGTLYPTNKLQVTNGSVGIDSQYMIRDNRNNTILLQSASTAASNRSLTIGNATYSNIIVPNGNVGIGTTSPSEKLEVVGDAKMTGKLNVGTTTDYADNAAALLAGLVVGDIYRTGDTLKIVH